MLWLIVTLFVFCKGYHFYNNDERFYHLRKIIGVGLVLYFNKSQHMTFVISSENTSALVFHLK